MNTIEEIRRRIKRVIQIERDITKKERDKFIQKRSDNESWYGLGGPYDRYTKCIEAREHHLDELDVLEQQSGHGLVMTETLRLYPWACPTCQSVIYLETSKSNYGGDSEIVDCPVCHRTIYRSGHYTTWEVVKGSKHTELHKW